MEFETRSQILTSLKTKNHRKYVWYDYSIVEKAKIQIIKSEGAVLGSYIPGSPGTENYLKLENEFTVQINPSDFKYDHYMDINDIRNNLATTARAKGFVLHSFGEREISTFTATLTYDIYDEYNARTANGTLPSDFSLENKNATSLRGLVEYVHENIYFARFIWGDIVKFGLLEGISVNYTAFSQWGQPLKATADLTIVEEPVACTGGAKGLDNYISGLLGFSSVKKAAKKIATGLQNVFR